MVQRKVRNKLSIETDLQVKSEKWLEKLGPASPLHQESKNKGTDLKKRMRKSRSINRTNFESLKSHALIREVPQPGKPPPLYASTPKKQSPIKGSEASPNYMKSTSSSDARKELSQVNSKSSQSHIESKIPKKLSNNSRLCSVSSHKPAKTLTRTSSFKLVRTLTKSPSFKPPRGTTKKCSKVVLYENLEAQGATCSSTLKDSKFPTYLALSPGATESEGTSTMKVCPYTYCSLNGHRHTPLPPLKSFLTSRRRMLKAQKSTKLGCLSPRQVKSSSDGMKENVTEQITLDEKPAVQEMDLHEPGINFLEQGDHTDFFIEIYVGTTENHAEPTVQSEGNGHQKEDDDVAVNEDGDEKVIEMCSNEAPVTEIDSGPNIHNRGEVILTEKEVAEEVYSASPIQEEETAESLSYGTDSEDSDMEWEEGQQSSALSLDDGSGNSIQANNEYDLESGSSFGDDIASFSKESVFKSDDIVSSYFNEISADEGLEGFFQEGENSDSEGSYQNVGNAESLLMFNQNYLVSLTNDGEEELTEEGRDGNDESENFMATVIALETTREPIEEPREAREEENRVLEADSRTPTANHQLGYDKFESSRNIKDEAPLVDCQENQYVKDMLVNQGIDSSQNVTKMDQDYSSGDNIEDCHREETVVESLLPKTEDPETKQSLQEELITDAGEESEEDQEDAARSQIRIPSVNLLQDFFEADQDMTKEDINEIQFGASAKEDDLNQPFIGEVLQRNKVDELQNQSEKDHHEASFKISDPMDSENQTHSGLNKVTTAENSSEDDNDMQVEYSTKSDPEETLPLSEDVATTRAKTTVIRGRGHPSEEMLEAPNNLKITRCKRPVEELVEPRAFNPRDPNYLPVEPDPEGEKVDLRHQMVDERKNAEEWMLDHALQQAVFKLAPARKRKVALLVEAFEKVIPIPKYEPRHKSPAFAHARPIQACS